ncbi:MAG: hypothetical protein ACRENE_26365 [Polyangiaceae bacterium]
MRSGFQRLAIVVGALALLGGPMACGAILGIGDPTVADEGGAEAGGNRDATSSGGGHDANVDGPHDATVPDGGDSGMEDATADSEASLEDVSEDSDAVADSPATNDADGGCQQGYVICTPDGGIPGTGPCVDLATDPLNCNGCGTACPVNHNSPLCNLAVCKLGMCSSGYFDCNGDPTDGCEINLQQDPANCGACGTVCPTGQFCVDGACGLSCGTQTPCEKLADGGGAPFVDGGTLPLYCADLPNDALNCGKCGGACPVNHNTPTCSGSTCHTGACDQGFADCNGDPSDGCEVNLQTDNAHCGLCINACSATSATTTCIGGQCAIFSCATGTGDCDHNYANGCEDDLTGDTLNCGACGNSCAVACTGNVGGVACTSSACGVTSCGPWFFDLDGKCSDGCECGATTVGSCTGPRAIALTGPGSSQQASGNLVPSGTSDWFTVTFSQNTKPSYHPHVLFMTNPGGEYVFDIETNCSGGTQVCGTEKATDGGTLAATGLTDWEVAYNTGVDFVDASFKPILPVGAAGVILVHVYRVASAPVDCLPYTLTMSN